MNKPYYYKISNKDGQYYFGSRRANKVNAWDDLLTVYKTSSNLVKRLGVKNFVIDEIIEFEDAFDAFIFEQTKIRDHKGDELMLNFHFKHPETLSLEMVKSYKGIPKSESTKRKMRKPKTEEHKKNLSMAQLMNGGNGPKHHSEETKKKIAQSLTGGTRPKWTSEQKAALSKKRKNTKREACKYCGLECQPSTLKRWHNDNCRKKNES